MDHTRLAALSFPDYPQSELSQTAVRTAYAKASAYVTLACIEADIEVPADREAAAAATDATHQLADLDDPAAYLDRAQQELAYAIAETDDDRFQRALERTRQTIADIQSNR